MIKTALICLMCSLLGSQSFAASYSSGSDYSSVKNYVTGALGIFAPGQNLLSGSRDNGNAVTATFFNSGLIGIGADYDYMYKSDVSFGGFLRYYSASTTTTNQTFKDGLFTIGPDVRGYFQT